MIDEDFKNYPITDACILLRSLIKYPLANMYIVNNIGFSEQDMLC